MLGWRFLNDLDKKSVYREILKPSRNAPGPFHLEIHPTDICNANCYFCNTASFRESESLPWPLLRNILEDAASHGLRSVRLSGGGEPLIYAQFTELIECLLARHIQLGNLTTNGIALQGTKRELVEQALPAYLTVSLNFATPEAYARGIGLKPGVFDHVCTNIADYVAYITKNRLCEQSEIHTQFFITRETIEDIPAMFQLAANLGVTAVTFRGLGGRALEERLDDHQRRRIIELLEPLAHEFRERCWIMFDLDMEGLGNQTRAIAAAIRPSSQDPKSTAVPESSKEMPFCLIPFYSATILPSGLVYPCCMLMHEKRVRPLGNIRKASLAKIWNGKNYRRCRNEIRESMIHAGPAPLCGHRCRHTSAACWYPGACSIATHLLPASDAVDYQAAVAQLRSSWTSRIRRMGGKLFRQLRRR